MIRTTVVFLCIFHIGLPLLRGLFADNKQDDEIDAAADSPTVQPTAKHELIPRDIFHLSCQILKETICWLLWNCLCSKSKTTTTNTGIPQQQQDTSEIDQWTQVVEHECMKNRKLFKQTQWHPSISFPLFLSMPKASWLKCKGLSFLFMNSSHVQQIASVLRLHTHSQYDALQHRQERTHLQALCNGCVDR